MAKHIIILFYFLVGLGIYSHGNKLDSLVNEAKEIKQIDIEKAEELWLNIFYEAILARHTDLQNEYYNKLYKLYLSERDLYSVKKITIKQIEITQDDVNHDPIMLAKLEVKLAYALYSMGNHVKSIDHLNKAMIIGTSKDTVLIDYFYTYIAPMQAANYATIADYEQAILFQGQVLKYFQETNNLNETIKSFNNLGEYYFLYHKYDKSLNHYDHSLSLSSKDVQGHLKPTAILGKSRIYFEKEEYENTIDLCHEAIESINLLESNYITKELRIDIHNVLSKSHFDLDQDELSLFHAGKSLEIATEYYGEYKHRRLAFAYNNLGIIYQKQGDTKAAIRNFSHAILNLSENKTDPQYLVAINGVISCKEANRKNEDSQELRDDIIDQVAIALSIYQDIRSLYKHDHSTYNLAEFSSDFLAIGISVCYDSYEYTSDNLYLKQGFVFAESIRSAALNDAIAKNATLNLEDENKLTQRNKLISLRQEQTYQLEEAKSRMEDDETKVLRETINDINFKLEILNGQLINHNMTAESMVDFAKVQEFSIRNNTSMVEYHRDNEFLYIFTIIDGEISCQKRSLDPSYETHIMKLLQSLTFENRHQFEEESARFLYQALWSKEVPSGSVMIVPTGNLSYVPFEVLLNSKDEYLIESTTIYYAQSLNSILQRNDKALVGVLNNKAFCVAPVFKNDEYLYLSESIHEAREIGNVIETDFLLNEKATKSGFLSQIGDFSIVHLSTHGIFNSESQSSYLQFIDEKLFLSELYNVKLHNSLISLSACETALGENQSTEGVLSLSRAFNYAGIPTVISSLWAVDETSTARIFKDCYTNIAKGQSSALALSNAKKSYLSDNSISPEFKTPFYWAPFVHWGVNKPLKLHKNKPPTHFDVLIFIVAIIMCGGLIYLVSRRSKRLNFFKG